MLNPYYYSVVNQREKQQLIDLHATRLPFVISNRLELREIRADEHLSYFPPRKDWTYVAGAIVIWSEDQRTEFSREGRGARGRGPRPLGLGESCRGARVGGH